MQRTILASILLVGLGAAFPAAAVVTYQGILADGGAPATGVYDLRFGLHGAAEGGSAIATCSLEDVTVLEGFFVVELSFGVPIDGSAYWLALEVRPAASTGAYTLLAPRQPVTGAPLAVFGEVAESAATADSAASAVDADALDGAHGAYYLDWDNRIGVPPELADGDDDTLTGLGCAAGEVPFFDGTSWRCSPDRGASYARTVVVGPVGDAAANGAALLAAVAALPTPGSQADGWQVELEPGRYDLGTGSLAMKPWLSIAGAGQTVTVVTSAHCAHPPADGATVLGAANAALRDLTVENTCGVATDWGRAVQFPAVADDGRLTRVAARTAGAGDMSRAVVIDGDRAVLERVTASASGGVRGNVGISMAGGSGLLLDCGAAASGGPLNTALLIAGATFVRRGTYTAPASDGVDRGIRIEANGDLQEVAASGADSAVVVVADSAVTVTLSRLTAQGKIYTQVDSGSLILAIEHSRIATQGEPTLLVTGGSVGVAATQLWGDPVSGTAVCAGVWDESWVFYVNACP